MITQLLAVAATTLAAGFLIPQILLLLRNGDSAGVSVTWAAFGVITNAGWVFYLAKLGLWSAVMAPALAVVSYMIVLRIVTSLHRHLWVWQTILYTASLVASMLVGGVTLLGVILAVTPAIQLTPELIAIFREPCPRGVSPTTWSLCATEATLWGLYGWAVSDTALVGYGLVTATGSLLILGRWFATRDEIIGGAGHISPHTTLSA